MGIKKYPYNPTSVDKAIASASKTGGKISKKGAKLIHRLLQGRH